MHTIASTREAMQRVNAEFAEPKFHLSAIHVTTSKTASTSLTLKHLNDLLQTSRSEMINTRPREPAGCDCLGTSVDSWRHATRTRQHVGLTLLISGQLRYRVLPGRLFNGRSDVLNVRNGYTPGGTAVI